MEPKFQSSFIPKGPLVSNDGMAVASARRGEKSLLGFLAMIIFVCSLLGALGVFGYKYYLENSIENMKVELEASRASVGPETVAEITRLNNRIVAAETIINDHTVLSPIFRFLEEATVRTVRFTDLSYRMDDFGAIKLTLKGSARGYAALALQADILNKSEYFSSPVFSDLTLDERGNVVFSFEAIVDQKLLSYKKEIERLGITAPEAPVEASSTATTSPTTR